MADLTSQNELAVNRVQWGVSLMAVGTVNINNPGFMLTFRNRRYPEEMLSQGTAKYEEALNAYNILMLYSGVQVHCSVNVVHSAAICVSARGKRILVGSNQTEPFEYVLVHARLYMHACAQTHTQLQHMASTKKRALSLLLVFYIHCSFLSHLWRLRVLTPLEVSLAQMVFTQPLNYIGTKMLDIEHDFYY